MVELTPAVYSYVTVDLLSNRVIAEVPFSGVSFQRALSKAGTFSGTISMIDVTTHLNLYESTKPGKTALYVIRKVRNDSTCVWGGIIWNRSYDAIDKTLQITGAEFPSYFYHRLIWKTLVYGTELGQSISTYAASNGVATINTSSAHGFVVGDFIKITEVNSSINGYKTVATVPDSDTFTFLTSASIAPSTTLPGSFQKVTDKYALVRDLIYRVIVEDLSDLPFPNDSIKPARLDEIAISSYSRTSNIVTMKTLAPHGLSVGQEIELNGVPTSSYFVSNKKLVNKTSFITLVNITAGVATITTSTAHALVTGELVTISNVTSTNSTINSIISQLNQAFTVTGTPSGTTFTVQFIDTTLNTPTILGTYASYAALIAAYPTGSTAKDGYLITGGELYVWDTVNSEWDSYGTVTQNPVGTLPIPGTVSLQTGVATLTTTANHSFTAGEKAYISNVGDPFDGVQIITGAPTATTFTFDIVGRESIALTAISNPYGTAVDVDFDGYQIVTSIPRSDVIYTSLSSNVAKLTTTSAHGLSVSDQIIVSGIDAVFNGTYTIASVPTPSTLTYARTSADSPTAELDRIGTLIGSVFTFENAPRLDVISTSLTSNVAKLTTTFIHRLSVGDQIIVSGIDAVFNGTYTITSVPTLYTLTYARTSADSPITELSEPGSLISLVSAGSNIASTPLDNPGIVQKTITNFSFSYPYVTVTSTAHGLTPGRRISLVNAPNAFFKGDDEGRFTVADVPTANTFRYILNNVLITTDSTTLAVSGDVFVTYGPRLFRATYGPYTANTDIGIDLGNELELRGSYQDYLEIRGDEDKTLGQRIDEIAETINGFEYRIDCEYDYNTASFTRNLVFLNNSFTTSALNGVPINPAVFNANKNVFEFPGNIIEFSIDESAEKAATRFFVSGQDRELGQGSIQPRAVATADDLLDLGWPLLDSMEGDNVTDKTKLFNRAEKNLYEDRPPYGEFSVVVNGSLDPNIGSYSPGDWCSLILDDEFVRLRLASGDEIRSNIFIRKIAGYTVSVPDSPAYPEKVTLELLTEWEADNLGNQKTG